MADKMDNPRVNPLSHDGRAPSLAYNSALDGLRGVAILLVILSHAHAPLFDGAFYGVDLFFVLSGFLIGGQLLRPLARGEAPSLRAFYLKRAFRILPAFWAVLAVYLLWPGFREAPGMEPWWKFASFVVNLDIDYASNAAFSHAWSLCVEEHFYLLFPALALLLTRKPSAVKFWAVCGAVLLGGVAVKRLIEPEEVADLIAFVTGPASACMTGSSYTMDSGWTAR